MVSLLALDFPPSSVRLSHHELLTLPAAQFFFERTKASVQDFWVDETDAKDLAEICSRLEGLPLAIQLAAARVNALGVSGIMRPFRISFHLFTGRSRGGHPRYVSNGVQLTLRYALLH